MVRSLLAVSKVQVTTLSFPIVYALYIHIYIYILPSSLPFYTAVNFGIDMGMSYTRVLHIKVAYRVPHK
jgi:hypothetical protein